VDVRAVLTALVIATTGALAAPPSAAGADTATYSPMPRGGIFNPQSAWRLDIRTAPVARGSAEQVKGLVEQVEQHYGSAALNINYYSTTFYTASARTTPRDVTYDDSCLKAGYTEPKIKQAFAAVPIPDDAVPVGGTDSELTVWRPSTDQLWEFWSAKRTNKGWSACWGGRLDNVSRGPGYFGERTGATATSLPNAGGMVGIREAQALRIDHALSLQLVRSEHFDTFSYPAQRSDGWNPDRVPHRIPQGSRLRLDPLLDVTKLGLPPLGQAIARAAQQYGFIVTDTSGAVAVLAESGLPGKRATGTDPWKAILGGHTPSRLLEKFPWDRVQVLPRDYAKPGRGDARMAPAVAGPATAAPDARVRVLVHGEPGLAVEVWFRRRGTPVFILGRVGALDAKGWYATSYRASDDYRYYARVGNNRLRSSTGLTQIS
jgi:hypothetical protein